jgi:hypothetical protein
MSEDELNQDSAGESEQSDEQPVSSEQSQESEATEQSPEQSVEGTDQSADQSDEKPADESGQPAEQSEEQGAESNEPSEQVDEQAADSDQPATSASADNTLAFADDAASAAGGNGGDSGGSEGGFGGGGAADDAVAADSGSGSKRNLKVVAGFTQEGDQKFVGDIMIKVFESDSGQQGRFLFPTGGQFWQSTPSKGNTITTPLIRGVASSEVIVWAQTRASDGTSSQNMDWGFAIPMPSGDTLQVAFDVDVGEVEKTVNAPDANEAKAIVSQSAPLKGHVVFDVDAQSVGNQQFRVTGKFYTGEITSSAGQRINQ